jgi:NADH-quinone oxidoreductase subunit G
MLGSSDAFNQTLFSAKLLLDIPFFYSLNQTVNNFSKGELSSVIMIGTNLRYEASLLNTMLRREQNRRGLSFVTLGAFNQLRYSHSHEGNSHRSLFSSIENRVGFIKNYVNQSNSVGILLGINNLRGHSSTFLQQLVRQLGKYFFVKTGKNDRLGYVHSSVGSMAFAHLGLITKNKNKKNILFSVGTGNMGNASSFNTEETFNHVVAFDTHFEMTSKDDNLIKLLPITSLYERDGHLLSIEGRLRKHLKVVTAPNYVYNLETYLTFYMAKNLSSYYL